jgi:hypothetical protein
MRFQIKKILNKLKLRKYITPDWKEILKGNEKEFELIKEKANGKKILIATSTGGHIFCSHLESLLAFALTYYGARVEILLCDKVLPACMMGTSNFIDEEQFVKKGVSKICNGCLDTGKFAFDGQGLKLNYYSQYISKLEIQEANKTIDNLKYNELFNYTEDEINIGEHSLAGALRYYAVGNLEGQKYKEKILRKYTKAGLITKKVISNFFIKNPDFEIVISNHAIYIPQGIIASVAKKYKKKIVSYTTGYRKCSFIFSHDDSYHFTMMSEPTKEWEEINLDKKKEAKIIDYLISRRYGTNDWIYYFDKPKFKIDDILKKKGIDIAKPIILMAPNIIWDANLIYPDNIFSNMLDWIFKTIDHFMARKDLQLIIRAHPGETNYDRISNQRVKEEILKKYSNIPENIHIIGPEENISTYALADLSNSLLMYASKVGMEFSPFGMNVIVAGESYVKNKNITTDPKSQKEYFEILKNLPFKSKKNPDQILRAKKYAYHFFFRRMIAPFSIIESPHSWPNFKISKNIFKDIHNDKSLKVICNSIINYESFIYDDN